MFKFRERRMRKSDKSLRPPFLALWHLFYGRRHIRTLYHLKTLTYNVRIDYTPYVKYENLPRCR